MIKSLKSYINYIGEGLFRNIGSNASDMTDWFMKLPIYMDQYNTKYDIRLSMKDPSRLCIRIGNTYKKLHNNRNLIIDLSPYIDKLAEHPIENCFMRISTGMWSRDDHNIHIHNKEAYQKNKDNWGMEFDKLVMVMIYEYPNPVSWRSNSPLGNGFQLSPPKGVVIRSPKCLLKLARYVDDYPRSGGFPDDENARWWTEFENNL